MSACSEFRTAMLTDPGAADRALCAHAESCADCAAFARRSAEFEGRLARALAVDLGAAGAKVIPLHGGRISPGRPGAATTGVGKRGWLAIAASITVAIGAVTGLWLAAPGPSLAADVVKHMADEPQAWRATDAAVPTGTLEAVLHDSTLHLTGAAGVVSYANSCDFRGHRVPHLVVQTDHGPVTVMVLEHDSPPAPVKFDESGYRGVILPVAGHGSIAVLTNDQADLAAVERIATRVLGSMVWGQVSSPAAS